MDWSSVVNQILDMLLPLAVTFLTGLFTYIGTRLKKIYEEKVNNETAKTVVQDAVKFVEQVYTDLKGKEKLEKATEQVSEVLQSKGITITDAEINMLIESAVYSLNEGWFKEEVILDNTSSNETIADTATDVIADTTSEETNIDENKESEIAE